MKESILRKLVLLLLLGVIVCGLWAVGANARKRVELKKSEELNAKLEKLIKANTVIVNDLKSANNRLADLKSSERILKKQLAVAEEKNEVLAKTAEKIAVVESDSGKDVEELQKEAETLKSTNSALGEEILNLKEKDADLKKQIAELKAQLESAEKDTPSRRKRRKDLEEEKKEEKPESSTTLPSSNKNFSW